MRKEIIEFNKAQKTKRMPDFQAGDVVKAHLKIKEGAKERIQVFEGLVIAIKGRQSSSPNLTIRKVSNGIGVEMILPLFSPNLAKIDLVKRAKVRRAKLYYVRGLTTKQSRMKYKDISAFIAKEEELKKQEEEQAKAAQEAAEVKAKEQEEKPAEESKTE